MKRPTNDLDVYIFTPENVNTTYPTTSVNSDGSSQLVYVDMSDDEFEHVPTEDFSLKNLLAAGIDPSRMRVNTGSYSKLDACQSLEASLASIDIDKIVNDNKPIENEPIQ